MRKQLMVIYNSVLSTSGWIATVLFFSTNVGSAVVMLFSALLFTGVTVIMGLALIRVCMTDNNNNLTIREYCYRIL